jgi:hypothetical protein
VKPARPPEIVYRKRAGRREAEPQPPEDRTPSLSAPVGDLVGIPFEGRLLLNDPAPPKRRRIVR